MNDAFVVSGRQSAGDLDAIVDGFANGKWAAIVSFAQSVADEQFGDEDGYAISERLAHVGPSPEEKYREAELHERLMQFVEELSPPLRKAFQLRDLDDLSTSEAAQILGVVDGTVKAQVARARAKLTRLVRRALEAKPRSSAPRTFLQVAEVK